MGRMGKRQPNGIQDYDSRMLGAIAARNAYERKKYEEDGKEPEEGFGIDGRPLMNDKTAEERQLEKLDAMGVKPVRVKRERKNMNSEEMRRMMDTHYKLREVAEAVGASINRIQFCAKQARVRPKFVWHGGYYSREDVKKILDYYTGKTKYTRDSARMVGEIRDMIDN